MRNVPNVVLECKRSHRYPARPLPSAINRGMK